VPNIQKVNPLQFSYLTFRAGNPLLPIPVIKHLSRFSNIVLIPCLTVGNIGASLSLPLLMKVGALVPIAIASNLLSMATGRLFRCLHEEDHKLFRASLLTIASPNSISMPIMVMQSLCELPVVKMDYEDDSLVCFSHSTALLFISSIGFHLLYWGYIFPSFERLQQEYDLEDDNSETPSMTRRRSLSSNPPSASLYQRGLKCVALFKHILLSPTMLAVIAGLVIGLIPFTRHLLFVESGYLSPVGGAINTLASPVVALNCLIMSASLAHIDVDFKALFLQSWSRLFQGATSPRRHSMQLSSEEEASPAFNPMQLSISSDNLNTLTTAARDEEEGRRGGQGEEISSKPSQPSDGSEVEMRTLERVLTEVIKDDGVEQSSVDTTSANLLKRNGNNLPQTRSIFFLILCRLATLFPSLSLSLSLSPLTVLLPLSSSISD
jgi:hypothetical protein